MDLGDPFAACTAALEELRAGQKRTHWMWFIFPQLRGLGLSPAANFYGISSTAEAEAYLQHAILGPRLIECTEAVLALQTSSPRSVFRSPDDQKFWSSMTLFSMAAGQSASVYSRALGRFFEGHRDPGTLAQLARPGS